jgi:hypothetical protein
MILPPVLLAGLRRAQRPLLAPDPDPADLRALDAEAAESTIRALQQRGALPDDPPELCEACARAAEHEARARVYETIAAMADRIAEAME